MSPCERESRSRSAVGIRVDDDSGPDDTALSDCPICRADTRRVFCVNEYPIHECPECRHRFVAEEFGGDHTAANYADEYFEGGGAGYTDYLGEEQIITEHGQRYAHIVNRHTKPGRLLDVGAAAGFIMNGFAREGWTCHGVEPNAQMATLARQSGFDVTQSGFENVDLHEQYDLISMIQVIPHFRDLTQAAERAAKLTRPGGFWLVETWNHRSCTATLFGRYWHEYSPPTVLHWFCRTSLDQLAAQHGMVPIASGRPDKYLKGQHAKSLLAHCFKKSRLTRPLTSLLRLIPDNLSIWYPGEDLTWVLYQSVSMLKNAKESDSTDSRIVSSQTNEQTTGNAPTTSVNKAMHYGSFSDPSGLVVRMLRSRNRAAYAGLLREALKIPVKPVDWLLSKFPRKRVSPSDSGQRPIILIVGPPRSGSTLVYQILARYCDVTYPDNLNSFFPNSPLSAMKWFSRRHPPRKPLIRSCYGQTARFSGPNEGFHIWDRWLGSNRYETVDCLSDATVDEMNSFLNTWTHIAGKPLVNKNNRSTACIELLSRTLPNSYFVVIERNERDIVRSVIRGREFVQGDKRIPWGLLSQHKHGSADPLGYVDDVCEQVRMISRRIAQQIQSIDAHRFIPLDYGEFCRDPASVLGRIAASIPGLSLRAELIKKELKPFHASSDKFLSPEEEARIDKCLD